MCQVLKSGLDPVWTWSDSVWISSLCVSLSVVPSLLCCLTSPLREVRRAALAALQTLSGAGVSLYQPIMEKLMMTSEEVLADPAYLSLVRRSSWFDWCLLDWSV